MNIETYHDNTPLKTALQGYIPRLCGRAKKALIPLSANMLRRHCQPFKAEHGASCFNKTRAIISFLSEIDLSRGRYLMSVLFASLPERARRLWHRDEWLMRVFERIGELQALAISGRWELINRKRFELSELLAAEII